MNSTESESQKVVIINAYGRSNRGDSVLLDECISDIVNALANPTITVVLYEDKEDHKFSDEVTCKAERIGNNATGTFAGKMLAVIWVLIALICAATRTRTASFLLPKKQRKTLHSLFESQLVISAPGGYIHDTNTALYVALAHIAIPLMLKKRVLLAPQSIGPIAGWLPKIIARTILSRVDIICARESYTREFLIDDLSIPPQKVTITGDSAFWNTNVLGNFNQIAQYWEEDFPNLNNKRRILGVTVVGWSFPNRGDKDALLENYICEIAKTIDKICFHYDLQPIIFNQVSNDIKTARIVQARCKSTVIVQEVSREPEILRAYIARSMIFLGTRFHSCIFAMMANVPTFAISYLPKTENILNDLGLKENSVRIDEIDSKEVIASLIDMTENLQSSKDRLLQCIEAYRRNFLNFYEVLKHLQKESSN
jgi:colanic acid/amylovoran biosynthesis protein